MNRYDLPSRVGLCCKGQYLTIMQSHKVDEALTSQLCGLNHYELVVSTVNRQESMNLKHNPSKSAKLSFSTKPLKAKV